MFNTGPYDREIDDQSEQDGRDCDARIEEPSEANGKEKKKGTDNDCDPKD